MSLNAAQIAFLKTYGHGDFAHLIEEAEKGEDAIASMRGLGDAFALFMLIELSSSEGCEDAEEATRRIEAVISDCQDVLAAVESLEGAL